MVCSMYFLILTCVDIPILGRSLMIVPRSEAKEGFKDVDLEDYEEDTYMQRTQKTQLAIIKDKWRDDHQMRVYSVPPQS